MDAFDTYGAKSPNDFSRVDSYERESYTSRDREPYRERRRSPSTLMQPHFCTLGHTLTPSSQTRTDVLALLAVTAPALPPKLTATSLIVPVTITTADVKTIPATDAARLLKSNQAARKASTDTFRTMSFQ